MPTITLQIELDRPGLELMQEMMRKLNWMVGVDYHQSGHGPRGLERALTEVERRINLEETEEYLQLLKGLEPEYHDTMGAQDFVNQASPFSDKEEARSKEEAAVMSRLQELRNLQPPERGTIRAKNRLDQRHGSDMDH
jgi:hypothetical protein